MKSKPLKVPEFGALKFGAVGGLPTFVLAPIVKVPTVVLVLIVKIIVMPTPVEGSQAVHSRTPLAPRFKSRQLSNKSRAIGSLFRDRHSRGRRFGHFPIY